VPGEQRRYLNGVVAGETSLSARDVLDRLLAIEREAGRTRPAVLAPRTLDLDLILFGDQRIDEDGLIVPHPRFRERLFVLEPLAEVAPGWRDPGTGKTISALLQQARQERPGPS
jgi:2-amino-4-hydroxy-6-hydroxymethyldihydropteridine diphosphokinase